MADNSRNVQLFEEDERRLTDLDKLIPFVAWKIVACNLDKYDDIEKCSIASPYFGALLHAERISRVVLPKVFEILGYRFCNQDYYDQSYNETILAVSAPGNLYGFLKCRLVCKAWNEAIEYVLRNKNSGHFWMLEDFQIAEASLLCRKLGNETFWTESKIGNYLDHFEITHYNSVTNLPRKCPFLGRSIHVWPPERRYQNEDVYFKRLLVLLRKYGDEIWYFKEHYIGLNNEGYVYWYQQLTERVKLMPNLRSLRITWSCLTDDLPNVLENEILRNPFPNLAKLELLATFQVPGQIVNHLLDGHRRITYLQVLSNNLPFDIHYNIFANNFPNLTRLCFEARSLQDFEMFERYPFQLKLTKLSFCWSRLPSVPFVPWSRIFSAIESKLFNGYCTELHLNMPGPRTDAHRKLVMEESLSYRLQISSIQQICFQQETTRFCVDFMLPFKNNLKEVHIVCDVNYRDCDHDIFQEQQLIKFFGFENHIGYSNIGLVLPSLKKIKISGWEHRHSMFGINEV